MKHAVAGTLLAAAGLPSITPAADLGPAEVRAIAREAYIYGVPLAENYRVLYLSSLEGGGPAFKAPLNTLRNETRLYTPEDRTIVTPNSDTLYSGGGLDLRAEPMVLTLPAIEPERYYSIQLVDLYTFNFDYLGSRTTGNGGGHVLVAGPDWRGDVPPGIAHVARAETQFASLFIRTQVFGPADLDDAKEVQAGYRLEPLSAFLGRAAPPAAPTVAWVKPPPPAAQRAALEFFDVVRQVLEFCPVHPSETALRARFARIGIVPGRPFDPATLAPETKAALLAGMADGQKAIDERIAVTTSSDDLFGTRAYLRDDYVARAVGAQRGIYGNSKEEARYLRYLRDADGLPLDASRNRYVIRFPSGQLPPARAFWSLTMYDGPSLLLVANPIDRYLVNSPMLPDLKRDADGGLTLHVRRDSPGADAESNWLPAPDGPFMMVMRIYWPGPEAFDGRWKQPPLVRAK